MTANRNTSNRRLALRLNLMTLWLSRHWLRVALIIVGVYASLPYVAPTLMKLGLTGPANVLYTLYSPFCHQFAFRSFFLFGEQLTYPRAEAGASGIPFEEYVQGLPEFEPNRLVSVFGTFQRVGNPYDFSPGFQFAAREYIGNPDMGYKTTLCQRDVAIYGAMFIGGLLYTRVRHRLRPVPIWIYIWLGILPIAIDGGSQLLANPPFNFWESYETLPIYRVITGAMFGLMNVWLAFPYLELSMRETRDQILAKLERAGIQVD
jgi:uncharacterized membrane protein